MMVWTCGAEIHSTFVLENEQQFDTNEVVAASNPFRICWGDPVICGTVYKKQKVDGAKWVYGNG